MRISSMGSFGFFVIVPIIPGIILVFWYPQDDPSVFHPECFSLVPWLWPSFCPSQPPNVLSVCLCGHRQSHSLAVLPPSKAECETLCLQFTQIFGPFLWLHQSLRLLQDLHFPLQSMCSVSALCSRPLTAADCLGKTNEQRPDFLCQKDPAKRGCWTGGCIFISGHVISKYLMLCWLLLS